MFEFKNTIDVLKIKIEKVQMYKKERNLKNQLIELVLPLNINTNETR